VKRITKESKNLNITEIRNYLKRYS